MKMCQIRIIDEQYQSKLEKAVNMFLELEQREADILSIQYLCSYHEEYDEHGDCCKKVPFFSAMIVYS